MFLEKEELEKEKKAFEASKEAEKAEELSADIYNALCSRKIGQP